MRKEHLLFTILLLLGSLGQVAADLYLPSLPAIAQGLTTKISLVQWSVSLYMWGYAFSQLIYGPLSDGIGRKKPLLFGVSLLLLGSVVCLSAPTVTWLIIGRFLQGAGAGSGVALSRAILRDTFSGTNLAKFSSFLSTGGMALMASAPLLGGYLQHGSGWRSNFIFLSCYAMAMLFIVVFRLPETNVHQNIDALKPKQWCNNFMILFKHPVFIGLSVIIFVSYAGILAWLTAGPVLLQLQASVTPVMFGWVALTIGIAYAIGALSNGKLVGKYGIANMITTGLILMLLGAVLMLVFASLLKTVTVVAVLIPMVLFAGGSGFVFANAYAGALSPFPKIAGIAGSVFGFMQILGGATASGLLAHLHEKTQIPLAVTLFVCAGIALLTLWRIDSYLRK